MTAISFRNAVSRIVTISLWVVASLQAQNDVQLQIMQRDSEGCGQGELLVEVDVASDHLYLKCGEEILLDAVCSTGSGHSLSRGDTTWEFETPRGRFRIVSIVKEPVWRRPDWAFLEEGESVPSSENERYLRGALGQFALGIGNGFFIHGTLYERLLGQKVTHGCIRLGAEDLELLAQTVRVGTPVVIY